MEPFKNESVKARVLFELARKLSNHTCNINAMLHAEKFNVDVGPLLVNTLSDSVVKNLNQINEQSFKERLSDLEFLERRLDIENEKQKEMFMTFINATEKIRLLLKKYYETHITPVKESEDKKSVDVLLGLLEENKDKIKDGEYLESCNLLMKLHNKEKNKKEETDDDDDDDDDDDEDDDDEFKVEHFIDQFIVRGSDLPR